MLNLLLIVFFFIFFTPHTSNTINDLNKVPLYLAFDHSNPLNISNNAIKFSKPKSDSIDTLIQKLIYEGNKAYRTNNLLIAQDLYNQLNFIAKYNNIEKKYWKELRTTLSYMSTISLMLQNIGNSISYLKKALEITLKFDPKDYTNSYYFLFNIAKNYYKLNDYYKAMDYYSQAKILISEISNISLSKKAQLYNNLGLCFLKLGIDLEARKYIEDAIKIKVNLGEIDDLALFFDNIAIVEQSKKQYNLALKYFNKSMFLYDSIKDINNLAFVKNNVGNLYLEKGSFDTCKYYYTNSLNLRKTSQHSTPIDLVQSYNNVAYINLRTSNLDSASFYNKLAFFCNLTNKRNKIYDNLFSISDYLISIADRIELNSLQYKKNKDKKFLIESYDLLPSAINVIIGHLKKLNSIFSSNQFVNENKRLFDLSILSASILDSVIKTKYPRTLIISEIFKSLSLINFPAEIRNLQSNSEAISNFSYFKSYYQFENLLNLGKQNEHNLNNLTIVDSLISNTIRIDNQYNKFLEKAFKNILLYYSSIENSISINIDSSNAKNLIIDYFITEKELFIHTILNNQVSCKVITVSEEFKKSLQDYPFSIKSLDFKRIAELRKIISKLLLNPVINLIKYSDKITFIPDESLSGIPFETLSINRIPNQKDPYLIEIKDISYRFSILNRNYSNLQVNKTHEYEFFGIAPYAVDDSSFQNLNGSAKEIFDINQLYINESLNSCYFIGENATYNNFVNGPLNAKILHLSTHSKINKSNSTFSCVELFPSKNESSLFFPVLTSLPFDNDLLILNACDSGSNIVSSSTGFVSFLRGILNITICNYICTLWKIYDEPSYFFIKDFYKYHLKGNSYSKSMAFSKRQFINSKTYKDPIFWSSFILYEND